MKESENRAHQGNMVQGSHAEPATISSLVADLTSDDGVVRQKARESLVAIGGPAVPLLIRTLEDPKEWVRWEAAKSLSQIADPASAPALVRALEDKMFDVRWLAAEGLIALGRETLVPLLEALIERSDSPWLLEGAHHVLHDLTGEGLREELQPLLAALEYAERAIEVPIVAKTLLNALKGAKG